MTEQTFTSIPFKEGVTLSDQSVVTLITDLIWKQNQNTLTEYHRKAFDEYFKGCEIYSQINTRHEAALMPTVEQIPLKIVLNTGKVEYFTVSKVDMLDYFKALFGEEFYRVYTMKEKNQLIRWLTSTFNGMRVKEYSYPADDAENDSATGIPYMLDETEEVLLRLPHQLAFSPLDLYSEKERRMSNDPNHYDNILRFEFLPHVAYQPEVVNPHLNIHIDEMIEGGNAGNNSANATSNPVNEIPE